MSSSDSVIATLLRDCLPPGRALGLARRLCEEHDLEAELSPRGDVIETAARALSDVPLPAVFEALREAAPAFLARIDSVAERVVPLEARLGRVLPTCPSLLCFVGRAELVDELVGHPLMRRGGHLHLHAPPSSGRTTTAGQVARLLAERVPVVAWVDGRCELGAERALLDLAAALGLPRDVPEPTLARLSEWLHANHDWAMVIDDDDETAAVLGPVKSAVAAGRGRLLTVGRQARPEASANIALAALSTQQRSLLVQRWSRRRAPEDAGTDVARSLGELAVVSAGWAVAALPTSTVAAARATLSTEAMGLLTILGSLAPAPVPTAIYTWPVGRPPPVDLPSGLDALLRSPRTARETAGRLVRGAWAYLLGDRLCVTSLGARQPRPDWGPAVAAALVLDALLRGEGAVSQLLPHVAWMADSPAVAPSVRRALANHMGRALLGSGEARAAVGWLQRAVAAAEGDPELPASAMPGLLNDLGVAWRRAGQLQDALSVMQEALRRDLAVAHPDALAVAATRTNLGHVLREMGELDAAAEMYTAALQLRQEQLGALHPDCAVVTIQLGVLALQQGARDEARRYWSDALVALGRGAAYRERVAAVLRHLARLDAEDGDLERAIERAERAHGLLVAEYDDPEHAEVAAVRAELVAFDDALEQAQKPVPRTR